MAKILFEVLVASHLLIFKSKQTCLFLFAWNQFKCLVLCSKSHWLQASIPFFCSYEFSQNSFTFSDYRINYLLNWIPLVCSNSYTFFAEWKSKRKQNHLTYLATISWYTIITLHINMYACSFFRFCHHFFCMKIYALQPVYFCFIKRLKRVLDKKGPQHM